MQESSSNISSSKHWPLCGGFPSQRTSNVENDSIWWRHHDNWIRLSYVSPIATRYDASFVATAGPVGCHNDGLQCHQWHIQLKTSSHRLAIESGRWARPVVPRDQRACPVCSVRPEDEYHLILICPSYGNIRKALIPICYHNRPSMYELVLLFNDTRKMVFWNLAKFIYKAFILRKTNGWSSIPVPFWCLQCEMVSYVKYACTGLWPISGK